MDAALQLLAAAPHTETARGEYDKSQTHHAEA